MSSVRAHVWSGLVDETGSPAQPGGARLVTPGGNTVRSYHIQYR